ncbi:MULTISPECIES: hypothetical protein [Nostocales]|uniref:Uncharacterized protein n=2 Tax=Nostocales TaxID=1161 RepID=A0ABW8WRP0_9CYAN|nr:hypothetical protein [Tolypothrix bouteillei]
METINLLIFNYIIEARWAQRIIIGVERGCVRSSPLLAVGME